MSWKKIKNWHDRDEYFLWIVLGVIILRIPSLLEPYWHGDEGIYLTLGLAMRKGLTLYSQIHDNKPPLLYLLANLAGNLMWLRVMLLLWNAVNVFIIGKLAESIFGRKKLAYLVAIVFGVFSTLPWLEGNVANGELFMIMPTALAVLLLVQTKDSGWKKYLLAGFLFSIAFLFKVPAVFDLVGVGLWFVFFQGKRLEIKNLKSGLWVALGFGVPIAATIGYYFAKDSGWQYIQAAFMQNVGYLSSWGGTKAMGAANSGLIQRGVVALLLTGLVWLVTRKDKSEQRLILVWLIWALFGVLLSERPYPHYLIQIVAPASLALGIVVAEKLSKITLMVVVLGLVVGGAVFKYDFYFYSSLKYYMNFGKYATSQISMEEYYNSFDSRVMQTYKVAKYIKERTDEGDRIFVWGDEPYIYALAERLPPGRFTTAYHIADFGGREETAAIISQKPPKYIIWMNYEQREFKELVSLMSVAYTPVTQIDEATIYYRVDHL